MQYNTKNEILIWAVQSKPLVKFLNFGSLEGYFLMFKPQKTKKIQKTFIHQFLIFGRFQPYIVNIQENPIFCPFGLALGHIRGQNSSRTKPCSCPKPPSHSDRLFDVYFGEKNTVGMILDPIKTQLYQNTTIVGGSLLGFIFHA